MINKKKILLFKFCLLNKLINFFIKKGYKSNIIINLNKVFLMLIKVNKELCFNVILFQLYNILDTHVEIRNLKLKARSILIPRVINFKKRIFLISNWIIEAIKKNFKAMHLYLKIVFEFQQILDKKEQSKALIAKNENFLLVKANRSNFHYRW